MISFQNVPARKRDRVRNHLKRKSKDLKEKVLSAQQHFLQNVDLVQFQLDKRLLDGQQHNKRNIKSVFWKEECSPVTEPITFEVGSDVECSFLQNVEEGLFSERYQPTIITDGIISDLKDILKNSTVEHDDLSGARISLPRSCPTNNLRTTHTETSPPAAEKLIESATSVTHFLDRRVAGSDIESAPIEFTLTVKRIKNTTDVKCEPPISPIYPRIGTTNIPIVFSNTDSSSDLIAAETLSHCTETSDFQVNRSLASRDQVLEPVQDPKIVFVWEFRDGDFVRVPCIPPGEDSFDWDGDKAEADHFSMVKFIRGKRSQAAQKIYRWARKKYLRDTILY